MVASSAMDDLRKRFKRTEDLNCQRQEQARSRSSAPRAPRLVEEQKLERDDEQQSKKQDKVRMGNFLGKNSADRFTDCNLANL